MDTLKREMDFIGTPGEVYYFRAQATDKVNNLSAWVEVGPIEVKAVTKYYALGGQKVAMRQGEEVYYLHGDHLGSTSLTTDEGGVVVSEVRYHPYGEERWRNGESVTDFGFTGTRNEAGFGLMDYNARYYSPVLGRFVSADTVVPDENNPQHWNRYAYTYNNPIKFTDPTGHCPRCIIDLVENIIRIKTGTTDDATVTSMGMTAGVRVSGVGPVLHGTYDLVSNEAGQIQMFYTDADGYYIDGLLLGDETTLQASETFLNEDSSLVPQVDSGMIPQINLSITKGVANGGRIGENVQRYGGKSIVASGGVGLFDLIGADIAQSVGIEEDGQTLSGVEVKAGGGGFGVGFPVTTASYLTESHPVFDQPIQLPEFLIPVCQVAGQCGN